MTRRPSVDEVVASAMKTLDKNPEDANFRFQAKHVAEWAQDVVIRIPLYGEALHQAAARALPGADGVDATKTAQHLARLARPEAIGQVAEKALPDASAVDANIAQRLAGLAHPQAIDTGAEKALPGAGGVDAKAAQQLARLTRTTRLRLSGSLSSTTAFPYLDRAELSVVVDTTLRVMMSSSAHPRPVEKGQIGPPITPSVPGISADKGTGAALAPSKPSDDRKVQSLLPLIPLDQRELLARQACGKLRIMWGSKDGSQVYALLGHADKVLRSRPDASMFGYVINDASAGLIAPVGPYQTSYDLRQRRARQQLVADLNAAIDVPYLSEKQEGYILEFFVDALIRATEMGKSLAKETAADAPGRDAASGTIRTRDALAAEHRALAEQRRAVDAALAEIKRRIDAEADAGRVSK